MPQMIRNPWLVPPALVLPALVPVLADFARLHDRSIAASTVETALPRAACARHAPHPLRHMVRFGLSRPGRTCSPSRSLAPLVGRMGMLAALRILPTCHGFRWSVSRPKAPAR